MMTDSFGTTEPDNRKLFVLCHEYTVNEGDPDSEETNLKQLFYSFSKERCEAEIPYYLGLPGFQDFPDGFEVMHITLETRYSESGFDRW
jgi:hypothetical protein